MYPDLLTIILNLFRLERMQQAQQFFKVDMLNAEYIFIPINRRYTVNCTVQSFTVYKRLILIINNVNPRKQL